MMLKRRRHEIVHPNVSSAVQTLAEFIRLQRLDRGVNAHPGLASEPVGTLDVCSIRALPRAREHEKENTREG